jgi:hypothetical protein
MSTGNVQHPDDRLDYDIDFSADLPDDVLYDVSAVCTPPGLTIDVQIFGQTVKVWVAGGTAGQTYRVNVAVAAESGRQKEETLVISVRQYT